MAFTESSVHESSLPWEKRVFTLFHLNIKRPNVNLCFDDEESILEEDMDESRADA